MQTQSVSSGPSSRHVLVVDEDQTCRELIRDVLLEYGVPVVSAANGMEAMKLVCELPSPRFVLLDLHSPLMDGLSLAEMLLQLGLDARTEMAVMTVSHGRVPGSYPRVLRKPFELSQLLALVMPRPGTA